MAKNENLKFIEGLIKDGPVITPAFIIEAIAQKAKEAAELTDEEVEEFDAKRPIVPAKLWRETGKFINEKVKEKYG